MSKSIPNNLSHRPVIKVENYDLLEEKYDDARGLSIGFSQWSDTDISAKVWRYTGRQWSPQSEELPLSRVIDLAILICQTYETIKNNSIKNFENESFKKPFAENVFIELESININDFITFANIFKDDLLAIEENGRMNVLYDVLKKII